ncbi:MAG: hypothetical protein NTW11_00930 [Candidatus Staskawiczbacteria bacterium]|nr:hypothetical protein [Candidatus Staskawiczbacteria bacterium]
MSVQVVRVLVLVFGASGGPLGKGGVALYEFVVGNGYRLIWNKDVPWEKNGWAKYVWPMDWLKNLLAEVKAMATPGTVIAPAMWGADVVHLWAGRIIGPVAHYRSVPDDFAKRLIQESGIPAHEWSRLMGHVHPEFYQMIFSSHFWRNSTCNRYPLAVVPLADWITLQLSGQQGHDQAMLHDQGAKAPTSKLVNLYFDCGHHGQFAPIWPLFGHDQLLEIGNGAYVVPCTHDSPLARDFATWGLWTGSWYGVFRKVTAGDGIVPGEKTFNAGLVFEAMPNNGLSAISNIGRHGPLYKALMNANGEISYERAARLALTSISEIVETRLVFDDEMLKLEPELFAKSALGMAKGLETQALAGMVNTIATKCKDGLTKAATALGVPMPSEVAIVGGFAENIAILKALKMHGITAVVPPFAGLATQAGAAAEALRRAGMASTTAEALAMFPNKELVE